GRTRTPTRTPRPRDRGCSGRPRARRADARRPLRAAARARPWLRTGEPPSSSPPPSGPPSAGRDLALEDLAGRPLRELVEEPDPARVLVGGELALHVLTQLLGRNLRAFAQDDRRADLLAQLVVRDADHRGPQH